MTMIGAAVGLGAVWRFPYMAGKFGGAAFVLFYMAVVLFVGIPALMVEWTLGRNTRLGTLGAYHKAGLPGGKAAGAFLFIVVFFATGYYSNALGWVGFHALGELFKGFHLNLNPQAILPPQEGFNLTSFLLQMVMTGCVISACGIVLSKGVQRGIEKTSKVIVPLLFIVLTVLIIRSTTLSGAAEGIRWYIGGFHFKGLTPSVMAAALGMAFFSMSLGGTFMVTYGSYVQNRSPLMRNALFTGLGASLAGILAGFAIFPAVFSFGLEPSSGPSLIFSTLPQTFSKMPAGWIFGVLFFSGLFGVAFLSAIAAFEVLVSSMMDSKAYSRKKAVWIACSIVYVLALPPMLNLKIFVPWDLTFGSGMQVLGSLIAVLATTWFIKRAAVIRELSHGKANKTVTLLYWWMRIAVPAAILIVGINWILESLFQVKLFG
jgi:NSS family neurotransmitter:Na+ symporter